MELELHAESGFAALNKQQLRDALETLGEKMGPNTAEATMRAKLCAVFGRPVVGTETKPEPVKSKRPGIPNLTANGRWEGKEHWVVASNPGDPKILGIPVHWEGKLVISRDENGAFYHGIPFNKKVAIGHPWFIRLQNAQDIILARSVVTLPSGEKVMHEEQVPKPVFPFQPLGVVEGTEDKPESLLQWYRWEAEKRDNFRKASRAALLRMHSDLYGTTDVVKMRQVSDAELRAEILRFLGPDFEEYDEDEAA